MNTMIKHLSPSASDMIRADHTHVLATFHQYEVDGNPRDKKALANAICLSLDIHAKLEEEIFYPAMRESLSDKELLDKSASEHAELHRLVYRLREMEPTDPAFDATLMELMREVMHHVADEETRMLPEAESLLGEDRMAELGAEMTRRRLQLMAPHAGEIASNTIRSIPASYALMAAGALVAGTYIVKRAFGRHYVG
ncbi:MAG TPA: hemerythrin domain-containing protein [Burkholderiaceae bacterium]|nr:hemerythrin domain-containing protein [Burkholderiaceae bacterium]